jgi:F0F1-type ATP synthase membrane subunit c/vacuolar-type H+-ATPase subunit K
MSVAIGFALLVAALPFAIIQQVMVGESIRDPRPNKTKAVWFFIATTITLVLAYAGMWIILFRSFG